MVKVLLGLGALGAFMYALFDATKEPKTSGKPIPAEVIAQMKKLRTVWPTLTMKQQDLALNLMLKSCLDSGLQTQDECLGIMSEVIDYLEGRSDVPF